MRKLLSFILPPREQVSAYISTHLHVLVHRGTREVVNQQLDTPEQVVAIIKLYRPSTIDCHNEKVTALLRDDYS